MRATTSRHTTPLRAALLGVAAVLTAAGCAQTPAAQPGRSPAPPTRPARVVAAPATSDVPTSAGATSGTAQATPPVNPCAKNHAAKLVKVSLEQQHLWMCARTRVVRDTAITSGMRGTDTETPRGHYEIQGRNRNSVLTLADGKTYDVKYWIPFDAPLFGFHDSPWQHFPYGSPQYRTNGSHGCVHMPLTAIAFLYHWSEIGSTEVTIA